MPAAFANPITDIVKKLLDSNEENPAPEPPQAPDPEPDPEQPAVGNPVEEPTLPEGKTGEESQEKSGKSGTQPQYGGKLPATATSYPLMLLAGALVTVTGLALLRVRPSRC